MCNFAGMTNFYTDNWASKEEWGAGILESNNNIDSVTSDKVKVMRLASFILEKVAKRKVPEGQMKPAVIMKLDIEGSEIEVYNL